MHFHDGQNRTAWMSTYGNLTGHELWAVIGNLKFPELLRGGITLVVSRPVFVLLTSIETVTSPHTFTVHTETIKALECDILATVATHEVLGATRLQTL